MVFHWENRKNDWWALGNFIFKWTIPLSRGRNGSRFISLMHCWCKIRLQALCVIPKIKCSCKMSAANTEKWREMPLSTKHKNKGSRKTKLQQLLLIFSVLVTELPSSFQKKHPAGWSNYASPLCHGPQTGRPSCLMDFLLCGCAVADDYGLCRDSLLADSFHSVISPSRPLYDKLISKLGGPQFGAVWQQVLCVCQRDERTRQLH